MTPAEFWKLLAEVAQPSLEDIFGKHLEQRGKSYAVAEGKGMASLGCLLPKKQPILYIDGWGKTLYFIRKQWVYSGGESQRSAHAPPRWYGQSKSIERRHI